MKRVFIGITGRAGAGKTTFANFLRDALAETEVRDRCGIVPFAAPVKEIATKMGWDGKKDEKGRRLLQLIGTECGRECIGQDVWVKAWFGRVRAGASTLELVTIADDVRFENEAWAIRSLGGLIVRIDRPERPPLSKRLASWFRPTHRSERGGIVADAVVLNDFDLSALNVRASLLVPFLVAQMRSER